MRMSVVLTMLFTALVAEGCSEFTIADSYGNRYGGFYDYGNQYAWQLTKCEREVVERGTPDPERKRYMQCCMWRLGAPVGNSAGCDAVIGSS